MYAYVMHCVIGLLIFLFWIYSVQVISTRHVLDLSTDVQDNLLLLSTLCFLWGVLAIIVKFGSNCSDLETVQNDMDGIESSIINKSFYAINNKGFNGTKYPLQMDEDKQENSNKLDGNYKIRVPPLLRLDSHGICLTGSWTDLVTCFSQIGLVTIGVHVLQRFLHFYILYKGFFGYIDLFVTVYMPVCVCVLEISVAVVHLLNRFLVYEESRDLNKGRMILCRNMIPSVLSPGISYI